MIEKGQREGIFDVTCSKCGKVQSFEVGSDSYKILMPIIKGEGWKNYKDGETWEQSCPECFKKWVSRKSDYKGKKDLKKNDDGINL